MLILGACYSPAEVEETGVVAINLHGGALLNRAAVSGYPPSDNPISPNPSGPLLAELSYKVFLTELSGRMASVQMIKSSLRLTPEYLTISV